MNMAHSHRHNSSSSVWLTTGGGRPRAPTGGGRPCTRHHMGDGHPRTDTGGGRPCHKQTGGGRP